MRSAREFAYRSRHRSIGPIQETQYKRLLFRHVRDSDPITVETRAATYGGNKDAKWEHVELILRLQSNGNIASRLSPNRMTLDLKLEPSTYVQ